MESSEKIIISYTTKTTKTTATLTGTETTQCVCECGEKISKIEKLNEKKAKGDAKCFDGGLDRHIDSQKHKKALQNKKPKSTGAITNWFKKKDINSNTNNNSNTTNNSSNTNIKQFQHQ
eukprot:361566_1